ncbi:ABC transporter permease [Thioclava sediminum]|mgnify:CR=1 FL=1|uniref:Xylose transport system permease protein XylH n=1 Tax=Thioclava sediminum TaxID=1915319 RepID=A0ABX3MWE9_9RHOB|nr:MULTISPECIES: multiple monosaccharide ABC transporter permease [Thioclava]MAQ38941.1 sugar ABC transporter permease [Thioclava sp.]OOY05629.1 ABC transporter permease [Thioclava sp. F28-4]OOY10181.1 ABC transporter permease [Thioclava sp. F36-7]OOY15426.1 ABC transporter permease [Thioclava sp. DLFJ4-1]OOY23995.1 ABC transporter permease [Thioclava sediminum]
MDQIEQANSEPSGGLGIGAYIARHIREYGLLFALIAIMLFFQIVTGGTLLKPVNITNLFLQNSYIIIMALGMLLVIVGGNIDLSVGSVMGFIGAFAAVLIVSMDLPVAVAIPACLVMGMAIGAVQGYFVAYWKIPSFIVTLAGMLVFRGLSLWLLEGQSIGPFPKSFQALSTGFIADPFGVGRPNMLALAVGVAAVVLLVWLGLRARSRDARYGIEGEPLGLFVLRNAIVAVALLFVTWKLAWFRGLPNVLLSMVILTIIYVFVTERTTLGRRVYAVGGNSKAAKLSGIRTERLTFLTFVNMGLLAALAGLVFAARLNTATPKAGFAVELDVIAAVFIGGASMSGGSGKIIGAVVGAFIMGVMNNGMSILGIGIDYQQVIKGLVLLAAVFFDVYNKNKEA